MMGIIIAKNAGYSLPIADSWIMIMFYSEKKTAAIKDL